VTVPMSQQTELPREEGRAPLREYLGIIWLRKWSIMLVTLIVLGAALLFSSQQNAVYSSEGRYLVKPVSISGQESVASQVNMETERQLVGSTQVAVFVIDKMDVETEPPALLRELEVTVLPGTEILAIRYEAGSPGEAQRFANAFTRSYDKFRRDQVLEDLGAATADVEEEIADVEEEIASVTQEQERTPEGSEERAKLAANVASLQARLSSLEQERSALLEPTEVQVGQVVQPANLPLEPVSPDHVRTGILALLAGLLLGVGVAFLRERLDDRLRSRVDLEEHIGAPVLAVVHKVPSWRRRAETPLITVTEPRSATSEAFRTLRTSLLFAASQRDAKTLLVTSPHAGEGKTATSANLAVVLAQARKRVLLISADLRKPRLHRFFDVPNDVGLTSVLIGEAKPWEVVADVGMEHLKVVPSGPVPGNPAELLGSDAMGRLLGQFRDVADFVILDSAPALVVADALTLAPFVDAALFVADAEHTTRSAVIHARNQMEQVNASIIGAVLNNFDPSKAKSSPYYYSYYYTYKYEEPAPRSRGLLRRRVGKEEGPYPVGGTRAVSGFERGEEAASEEAARDQDDAAIGSVHRARMEGLWGSPATPEGNGEELGTEIDGGRQEPRARRRR
jgi:capsular exopolysaccharide synthesis family protein